MRFSNTLTKQEIRELFASAIDSVSSPFTVFCGTHITDLDTATPCVSIFMDAGSYEPDLQTNYIVTASVELFFISRCQCDGDMDIMVDPVLKGVGEYRPLLDATISCRQRSFVYEREAFQNFLGYRVDWDVMYAGKC